MRWAILFCLAVWALAIWLSIGPAYSHSWYDSDCCNTVDCRPVEDGDVVERADGVFIPASGDLIPYGSPKIRMSQDGKKHLCTVAGAHGSSTLCVYLPGRGS